MPRVYAWASNVDRRVVGPRGATLAAEPQVPDARGGTGAAAAGGRIVSVGGEAPDGTRAAVYSFDVAGRRWLALPSLSTPRHGLGVVTVGGEIYAIGGGPQPGLTVAGANEVLQLS